MYCLVHKALVYSTVARKSFSPSSVWLAGRWFLDQGASLYLQAAARAMTLHKVRHCLLLLLNACHKLAHHTFTSQSLEPHVL